jgi:hypothetical protein
MKLAFRFFTFILILFMLFSCGGKKEEVIPDDILPHKKMVMLLCDVHMAEAAYQIHNLGTTDSTKNIAYGYYRKIFEKNKISEADFKKSFLYYSQHPDVLNKIYQDVITEMSKRQAEYKPVAP